MRNKIMAMITAFALTFVALSFTTVDYAAAKGYKSGKRSFTPSQNQTVPTNKSQNSNIKQTTPSKPTPSVTTKPKSKAGSFAKGLLLGGLGGLLLGSLFAGLGPIGTVLAFMINMMLFAGIIMIAAKLFKAYKKKRQKEREAWKQ
ncbi:hypothetical protein MUG87_02535 [Ectobacillus sp. JY-23]|uniref:hypothetical protein n=1 Tax=Ectobacillus sp. JY-23 TaxID=2933872 RepID=UPI001FF61C43|nr:hypothetical protein [Ectobacillus sp. JY-23]UOY93033.1 hypothetical protein MUG87_02535 [Ectobacillus sp. JY-23]